MAWFDFLKEEGYFDPQKNPSPVPVQNGFTVPYWEALGYLQRLSTKIKEGNNLELTDEIIAIIRSVSDHPKDNYITWYNFIQILSNLPNDKIPVDILEYIPVWLSSKFDTALQTSELCENLLPKFLPDTPTKEDIEKAEIILKHLFDIEKIPTTEKTNSAQENQGYQSKAYLYYLSSELLQAPLITRIAQYCSSNIILILADHLRDILLFYPNGINIRIRSQDKEYSVCIFVQKKDLEVSVRDRSGDSTLSTAILKNYIEFDELELRSKLVETLKTLNVLYESSIENEENITGVIFNLNADWTTAFNRYPIGKLGTKNLHREKPLEIFAWVLRDLLNAKAKFHSAETLQLLEQLSYDKKYRLPFFRRIVLYVIGENWELFKSLFWKFVKGENSFKLFLEHKYYKELFEILAQNQHKLLNNELNELTKIIDVAENVKGERIESWKLRWYSALNQLPVFKEQYDKLSEQLDTTIEYYKTEGEILVRSGTISPVDKDEVLNKSNKEIRQFIADFKPVVDFGKPSIDGFADVLQEAVEANPQKFAEEIFLYKNVPYIYVYHILNGFGNAWKNHKSFDWDKLLMFCKDYIQDEHFYSEILINEDYGLRANADWVIGAISDLLSGGMQSDENAFEFELLPVAKEIIITLVKGLTPADSPPDTDYIMYSLNSTNGRVLRALLDYSLRKGRAEKKDQDTEIWDADMKFYFNETLNKGIIDGFVIEGRYFSQFYFLDKDWITAQVKNYYTLEHNKWLAFISGFVFGSPPSTIELYKLFYPHYDRIIINKIKINNFYDEGIIRHLVAFFFWGYDDLKTDGLIVKFLNTAHPASIDKFVNFIWTQENAIRALNVDEQHRFENIIFELWKYIAQKYEIPKGEEEQKSLANLSNLSVFIPKLDEGYTSLLLKSASLLDRHYTTHELVEDLLRLKTKGRPEETAKYIGEIINAIPFNNYLGNPDRDHLKALVSFLFENEQKELARNICSRLYRQGHEFIRGVYNEHNS